MSATLLSGQAPGYLQEIQQKWQNARDYTMELAEAMPEDDYGFAPTEDQMPFQAQLLHIVSNMNWLSSAYLGGQKLNYDLKAPGYSKTEVLAILAEGFELAAAAIAALQPSQLEEPVEFFAGPMSKRQILTLMNDHLTHHRGQLAVYLRLQGVKPPRYRGW